MFELVKGKIRNRQPPSSASRYQRQAKAVRLRVRAKNSESAPGILLRSRSRRIRLPATRCTDCGLRKHRPLTGSCSPMNGPAKRTANQGGSELMVPEICGLRKEQAGWFGRWVCRSWGCRCRLETVRASKGTCSPCRKDTRSRPDVLIVDEVGYLTYRMLERGRLLRLEGPSLRTKHVSGDDLAGNDHVDPDSGRISGIDAAESPERTRAVPPPSRSQAV